MILLDDGNSAWLAIPNGAVTKNTLVMNAVLRGDDEGLQLYGYCNKS